MRADIDQRTAALLLFVDEHTPGRNCSATDSDSLGIVDFAEVVLIGEVFKIHGFLAETVLIADGEDFARLVASFNHLLGFLVVHSHRLFAENVLAGVERVDGDAAMLAVVGEHEHRVDALVFKELFVVGVNLAGFVAVLLVSLDRALFDDVAERYHFGVRVLLFGGHVLAVCDTAAADNAYSHFFHDKISFMDLIFLRSVVRLAVYDLYFYLPASFFMFAQLFSRYSS